MERRHSDRDLLLEELRAALREVEKAGRDYERRILTRKITRAKTLQAEKIKGEIEPIAPQRILQKEDTGIFRRFANAIQNIWRKFHHTSNE